MRKINRQRTKIYVKATSEENEITFSGIEFAEFINYLNKPIENLMMINGGGSVALLESKFDRRLEIFEGTGLLEKLTKIDIYSMGDFCFVDYDTPKDTENLSEDQIAELLYMGHMFKPLRSPFYESLNNRFAYLAHDDGWYCKLYCRDFEEFVPVLLGKITSKVDMGLCPTIGTVGKELLQMAELGIFIDIDEISYKKGAIDGKIYIVCDVPDFDILFNNIKELKRNASKICNIHCDENRWSIF